ncbi:MAG: tRNA-specific 2-thiouridylase [Desulfosarcina sp.]|nr:tRNA-specific 2-thiouridylase [Desulfosarcina sp.]MBC2767794.1 tRNA-specific 2-thiouridylase [Desulfosarcina sp.]
MTGPIAIAVSGGVDSLVSAYLLKRQGFDIFGIYFLTGYENHANPGSKGIQGLCRLLDMPVFVIDLKTQFKTMVVDYFIAAYQRGETPNPCLVCNPTIKFGLLLREACKLGASRLATGHYARVEAGQEGRYRLRKGVDRDKDQSYFLSRLTQDQLAQACFPLGTWTKAQVRALATEKGLQPVTRQESQDVCFIREATYADFLTHYVVRIDTQRNRLVVGFKDKLYAGSCRVTDINWIAGVAEGPMAADTRIRYRHRAVASMVSPVGRDEAVVRFDQPQTAVTPGQGAVFYRGDEVVGAGWIKNS